MEKTLWGYEIPEETEPLMDDEDFLDLFFKVYGDVNQDVNA